MSKKITTEQFIEKAKKIHNNIYNYSQTKYVNCSTKVKIICKKHGVFLQTASDHVNKRSKCPKCSRNFLTKKEFIKKAKQIYNNKYSYSEVDYKNLSRKVIIICSEHGKFLQTPKEHIRGHNGCKECYRLTEKKFMRKIKSIYKDKYNFSKTKYKNLTKKVIIICKKHGEFTRSPYYFLNGSECKTCIFVDKANKIHNNKYDYSKSIYKDRDSKVKITCKKHGEFEQSVRCHLENHGCSSCQNKKLLTTKRFIEKAKQIHGNKYNYSKVKYINNSTKINIICLKHGIFKQRPNAHLCGRGCYKCGMLNSFCISKKSQKWLDKVEKELGYKLEREYFISVGRYIVDGFDSKTNTCYEYHGDYWHGNPKIYDPLKFNKRTKKTFGELFSKTKDKETLIKDAGYNLVIKWENDKYKLNRSKV